MLLEFKKIRFPIGSKDRLHAGSTWVPKRRIKSGQLAGMESIKVNVRDADSLVFTCDKGRVWTVEGEFDLDLELDPDSSYTPTWLLVSDVTEYHDTASVSVLRRLFDDPYIHTIIYVDYIKEYCAHVDTADYHRVFDVFRRDNRDVPSSVLNAMNHRLNESDIWVAYIDSNDHSASHIVIEDEHHATLLRLQYGDALYEIDFRETV